MAEPASPMIAASATWDELLRALAAKPGGDALASLPKRAAAGVLAAPAAIARWIALRAPQLAERDCLRVLVIGAEKLDAVDGGRWYALITQLLECRARIEATLVGDRLERRFASAPGAATAPHARHHLGSLADYLESAAVPEHDLAFVFHPGFQKHQGWLRDGSLARLVARGTPLVAAAYEREESEIDRRVAVCHGFSAAGEPLENPFFVDLGDARSCIRWGHVLWQFGERVPTPTQPIDARGLEALERLAAMVMHSIACGIAPAVAPGAAARFVGSNGAERTLIHVFDGYFLDPQRAELASFGGGSFAAVGTVAAADVAAYPGAAGTDLERALWAAELKARYLLAHYAAPPDVHAQQQLARSMYAELNARVDALFSASRSGEA